MADVPLYAHTPGPSGIWHLLGEHLQAVAELAEERAAAFGAADLAWWAGILHDAGKASEQFQAYLRLCHQQPDRKHPTVDHKGAGFLRALTVCEPLALLIQGHHGGLNDAKTIGEKSKDHASRRKELIDALTRFDQIDLGIIGRAAPNLARYDEWSPRSLEFLLRMLFSALVDADHFDTERHRNPHDNAQRGRAPAISDLWRQFEVQQQRFTASISPEAAQSDVNRIRAEVYDACLAAAERVPGFFRLTVPTGGGKTRSGLGFALKQADRRQLRRVIIASPYLTITDQTARIVGEIFPDDRALLEHHSAAGQPEDDENGTQDERESWRRLAAQDWDAPIVVTTMVQLFESLLGRKTTVCRKLHRIAKSVIILDEAQTIPPALRGPIYDVLHELVTNYGVSVVLCTATQPALDTLPEGIEPVEIAPDPPRLFRMLERVSYSWPQPGEPKWSWERTADEMRTEEQCLAIVNTVANAQALFSELGDDNGHFHLSSRMCGAHRRDVFDLVRARLTEGQACRLVSTQVVEAGVDLDFPLLLRALGPLDRIVQAAGRCNREGAMLDKGRVVVFDPEEGGIPPGTYRTGADTTKVMRSTLLDEQELDLNDPATFASYFTKLNRAVDPDGPRVQPERAKRNFETVAADFHLIDQDQASVVVRYRGMNSDLARDGEAPVDGLIRDIKIAVAARNSKWLRSLIRRAQPFLVNLRKRPLKHLADLGFAEPMTDDLWLWLPQYDNRLGLIEGRLDQTILFSD